MAFKYREEIVGKRFLSVSGFTKLKPGKTSEWGWRAGVIRAATHRDNNHPELQVLVEYDEVEWHRREWISLFKDNLFHLFMVEQGLAWVERKDPFDPTNVRVLWPAFTFTPLVSTVELTDEKPVEFLVDRELAFENYKQLEPFQDWDRPGVREYPELKIAVRRWAEQQDGQRILLTTPSVLLGYRVEVYRAEGTTQWYTAVIVGYNEATRDLTVTDDTVLEEHNEDPALVQMRLIGDGVVESIMRGEDVGITPRRSRSAGLQTHHPSRGVRGLTLGSRKRTGKQSTSPEPPDRGTKTRKRKSSDCESTSLVKGRFSGVREDLENNKQCRNKKGVVVCNRKKKVLEEATNGGLRQVEIRVEDCLQNIHHLHQVDSPLADSSDSCVQSSVHEDDEEEEVEEELEEGVCDAPSSSVDGSMPVVVSGNSSVALSEEDSDCVIVGSPHHHHHHLILHQNRLNLNRRGTTIRVGVDDDGQSSATTSPFNRMELVDTNNSLLRFPDDRSDSGVSSLRSSSGDERSGSRSSALSSTDETTPQQNTSNPTVLVTSSSILSTPVTSRSVYPLSSVTQASVVTPSTATSSTEPVRVWRDPNLLLESEPHVRHIHSVQHQTLLMSHPSTPAASGPPNSAAAAAAAAAAASSHPASLYPPSMPQPPPPTLITPHPMPHHPHLAPPALYAHPLTDMIWKHQRFSGLPVSAHLLAQQAAAAGPHPEDLIERERAATVALLQDRDRHDRIMRERQQQEVEKHKEMERLERERQEREKMEREREREREKQERERELLEKERQEQALHNHFEKSLRQAAQQKVTRFINNMDCFMKETYSQREQWNPIGQKQPPPTTAQQQQQQMQRMSNVEEERKRAEEMHQREQSRHLGVRQDRDHRTYYTTTGQRPSSVPGKAEYPPPPAHSRVPPQKTPTDKLTMNSVQKSDVNMFGYPVPYFNASHDSKPKTDHHKTSLVVTKSAMDTREVLTNPSQMKNEVKNSVIVKHDGKNSHHLEPPPRVSVAYSPTSKVGMNSLYMSSGQGPKGGLYEYRSPTQSPQHLHRLDSQNLGKTHHRQLPSPHHHQRQSPHHPSPQQSEIHYRTTQDSQPGLMYPVTKPNYPYMNTTVAYSIPNASTPNSSKPKVSSPAPHHFYGKPGVPAKPPLSNSVSPSPYQQASQYNPPHPQVTTQITCPPPPAHSRTPESRLYPSSQTKISPPARYATAPPSVQTQPLDLGVSSSVSPKRKAPPVSVNPVSLEVKKRRVDAIPPQSMYLGQPQLARVSEPSPLIASAATTITTVVNTAAYRAPIQTSNSPVNLADDRPSSVERTQVASPVTNPPAIIPTEETRSETPVKLTVAASCVDSEKSNSPNPAKTTYQGHKHLKKQWLQSYTGEDNVDSAGVTGSGSCVTINMSTGNTTTATAASKEPMHSIHSIGSMAVNSINKSKHFSGKTNNRKTPIKENLNGHPGDNKGDDSSSSDQDRGRKSPPKRKPPKVKRKKGGGIQKPKANDEKKRKSGVQSAPASESGSESEKESGSDKDSDSGGSTTQQSVAGKKSANLKEPRKRGRRPKSSKNDKGEESRPSKKANKEETTSSSTGGSTTPTSTSPRDPFRKPPVGQLKKTGESFLQDGPCFEVAPKLAKCRECRWTPNQRSKNMPNIFCRFYAFRRLRYTKNGQLAIAGFSDPHKDALEDDLKLWLPNPDNPPSDLDLDTSRFILKQVGDHFCDLFLQEKEAHAEYISDDKTVAWKRVVQGVREMCDVCETTLFNFHYACGKCGFVVCIDCYKSRRSGSIKVWGEPGKDRDEYSWLLCTNRQGHEQDKLMLTQIIAGDSLPELSRMVHEMRELWNIEQFCACLASKEIKGTNNHIYKDIVKRILSETKMNGVKREIKEETEMKPNGVALKDEKKSPLSWLADVALSTEDKKVEENNSSSDSEEGSFSTLRELLIRPSHKPNGSRAGSPVPQKNAKKLRLDTLDEVISSVIEDSVPKNNENVVDVKPELKHFLRRYNWQAKGRAPLPIRIMTLTESKLLYPDVPHSWLCDGKLLRLSDSNHKDNTKIFQDQWRRGQPVIVSDVTRNLDRDLWSPDSFARDFGDEKNDLINCMTGNLVPNQPMRKFWEGFDHFSKRLKDDRGNPMLLKLKDWPPGEDFAEMLPSRFTDLLKVLPLAEYTHRTGRLNLASRLPDCFVRPDLGPKMYNAYGSALHPSKGTTNLHLDISDAVNVMVYVGIPKDGDSDEHIKEAFRAIDEAGCDILTRRRVRDKGELPGALWHIYNARDADKIRDLLNKVVVEKGGRLEPHHDPIHDQSCYLDGPLRERLYKEYGVEGYAIVQCLGDAVFIPAGAPHQVRNLHNCIKVAEDFVSPENVSHCFHLTQEFRDLSDTHTNHEDKLQIKNIIYHAMKDALSCIVSVLQRHAMRKKEENGNGSTGDDCNAVVKQESQTA